MNAVRRWLAVWLSVASVTILAGGVPAVAQEQPVSTMLLEDRFQDAGAGWLPRSSPTPERYLRGYDGGEYFIQKVDPDWTSTPLALVPGTYGNATIAVDVRMVGDTEGRFVALECRRQSPNEMYRATVNVDRGLAYISRWDGPGQEVVRTTRTPLGSIARGNETNHLEFSCTGDALALTINGIPAVNVRDAKYREGALAIGVSAYTDSPNPAEARFSNLVVSRPGPAAGVAILTDNFDDPARGVLPGESRVPTRYRAGYVGGEYEITDIEQAAFVSTVNLPGSYEDATIGLDVRLVGDPAGRSVAVACRRQTDGSQYRLTLSPSLRRLSVSRWDAGEETVLADQASQAVHLNNEVNRVELTCAGHTIEVTINGQPVASVEDDHFRAGSAWIGVEAPEGLGQVRFDNLVVTQR